MNSVNAYRVHMRHWQRYMDAPEEAVFIERVEVVVLAQTGDLAAKAAKLLLGDEWSVSVVMPEVQVQKA